MTNPEFDPSLVKNASRACEGLCKWVRALDVYDRVVKIVAPKKLKLVEAETELGTQMQKLNTKRKQLQDVCCSFLIHRILNHKLGFSGVQQYLNILLVLWQPKEMSPLLQNTSHFFQECF